MRAPKCACLVHDCCTQAFRQAIQDAAPKGAQPSRHAALCKMSRTRDEGDLLDSEPMFLKPARVCLGSGIVVHPVFSATETMLFQHCHQRDSDCSDISLTTHLGYKSSAGPGGRGDLNLIASCPRTQWSAALEKTASKDASANGSFSAIACFAATPRACAAATMSGDASTPTTSAPLAAIRKVQLPVTAAQIEDVLVEGCGSSHSSTPAASPCTNAPFCPYEFGSQICDKEVPPKDSFDAESVLCKVIRVAVAISNNYEIVPRPLRRPTFDAIVP